MPFGDSTTASMISSAAPRELLLARDAAAPVAYLLAPRVLIIEISGSISVIPALLLGDIIYYYG